MESEIAHLTPRQQVDWYFEQAAIGDERAKRELGRMYFFGFTHPEDADVEIRPDATQARQWLTDAADGGDGEAALLLGMLLDGEATNGEFNEPREAFRRYQQAVDLDCREARTYLGSRYLIGRGTERNDRLGRTILIEAAYAGDEAAQRLMAEIYVKDGEEVPEYAWRIARATFHDQEEMPDSCPRESLERARLLIQKINIYSALIQCDAPELIEVADLLRERFVAEI